jgi:hypothetical protein
LIEFLTLRINVEEQQSEKRLKFLYSSFDRLKRAIISKLNHKKEYIKHLQTLKENNLLQQLETTPFPQSIVERYIDKEEFESLTEDPKLVGLDDSEVRQLIYLEFKKRYEQGGLSADQVVTQIIRDQISRNRSQTWIGEVANIAHQARLRTEFQYNRQLRDQTRAEVEGFSRFSSNLRRTITQARKKIRRTELERELGEQLDRTERLNNDLLNSSKNFIRNVIVLDNSDTDPETVSELSQHLQEEVVPIYEQHDRLRQSEQIVQQVIHVLSSSEESQVQTVTPQKRKRSAKYSSSSPSSSLSQTSGSEKEKKSDEQEKALRQVAAEGLRRLSHSPSNNNLERLFLRVRVRVRVREIK